MTLGAWPLGSELTLLTVLRVDGENLQNPLTKSRSDGPIFIIGSAGIDVLRHSMKEVATILKSTGQRPPPYPHRVTSRENLGEPMCHMLCCFLSQEYVRLNVRFSIFATIRRANGATWNHRGQGGVVTRSARSLITVN